MKKYTYILALFVIMLSACKKDEVIGGTAVQDMSGEWWVQVRDANGEFDEDYGDGYVSITTYNTADNSPNQMWIEDSQQTLWAIKGKVGVNATDKTFSGENIENQVYESQFTIANGKITKDGAIGPSSKAVTDAISFEISFSDDEDHPGRVLHLSGYHRTKFSGDDH